MINFAKGDLLKLAREGQFDVIVHGCNCFCNMGSGIARQIRDRYPEAFEADCATLKGDRSKLGDYTFSNTEDGFTIINAYTQYDFNKGNEIVDRFDYEAFELVLSSLVREMGDLRFGLPYIGTGLAGGNADKILSIIEKFAEQVAEQGGSVTLVEYKKQ